jgi:hypothetical protein
MMIMHDDVKLCYCSRETPHLSTNATMVPAYQYLVFILLASLQAPFAAGFSPSSSRCKSAGILRTASQSATLPPPHDAKLPLQLPTLTVRNLQGRRSRGLALSSNDEPKDRASSLPFFLDPATKGGVVFYTVALFVAPILLYNAVVGAGILDEISAGRLIGVGFTIVASLAWVSTYVFRVATKDMTYVSVSSGDGRLDCEATPEPQRLRN